MDARSIALVQNSFEDVAVLGEKVAEIFYGELFAIEPGLKKMFKGDMAEQRRKLLTTLALVVRSLREPQKIIEGVKTLATRHVAYGVEPSHYTYVGNALLRTLQKGLGDRFTSELQQAWVEAYTMLADIMKSAAYGGESVADGSS
jgi:nitric oxide dioxygenase